MSLKRFLVNIFGIFWFPIFLIKFLLDYLNLYASFLEFFDFLSIRVLYRLSKGKIIYLYRYLDRFLNIFFNRKNKNKLSISGKTKKIVGEINKNGFFIFKEKLIVPSKLIDTYNKFQVYSDSVSIKNNKVFKYKTLDYAKKDKFRLNTRFFYYLNDLLREESILKLIFNKNIWETAFLYLGENFCLQSVHSWSLIPPTNYFLSLPKRFKEDIFSDQAQSFHFDLDWPIFIKFFICIDDAKEKSGPFEYIPCTHIKKRKDLFIDRRISKKDLRLNNNSIVFLKGKKGTFAAFDTVGFHRDGRPKNEQRTVLQLEFASSALGNPLTRTMINKKLLTKNSMLVVNDMIDTYPRSLRAVMK